MAPERKRPTRSQLYQHLLVEKAYSNEMMEMFSNDDSVYRKLNPFDYDERILVLEDQLKERFWEIINSSLTDRQLEIVNLLKEGKTQQETAKQMKVNQCLFSDTLIYFNKYSSFNSQTYSLTIQNLYDMWNVNSNKVEKLYIKCFDLETKKIINTNMIYVASGGVREVIEILTSGGKNIKASADHKFLTPEGWIRLEDVLKNKLSIMVEDDGEIVSDNIVSFDIVGGTETYDIEVESRFHNFIANNVIVSNSSITKSLNGNVSYEKGSNKVSYGGIVRKVNKIIDQDPIIKKIKDQIAEIRNNSYY